MKLLTRTNLYYVFFSIVTYFVIATSFYFVTEYIMYKDVDERLLTERKDFENYIQANGYWLRSCYFVEDKIDVEPLPENYKQLPLFKDTVLLNHYTNTHTPFREYSFAYMIGEDPSKVTIRKSLIESNQLLKIITIVMLILLSIGLALLYIFQRKISQSIWRPFYATLENARHFDVHEGKSIPAERHTIFEFNELNASLSKMTDKMVSDYQSLKEFTEDASHELQTPLALINGRVEELIQQKGISEHQMSWIQDIYESSLKLSKLNQALFLLAKIDNQQFHEKTETSFDTLIKNKLEALDELFSIRCITINYHALGDFTVGMHPILSDILITNLINNAVKHNLAKNGVINISISKQSIIISNTGSALTNTPDYLFERFKKDNKSSNSLGLGLAIVKKICTTYNLSVLYAFENDLHTLTVKKQSDPTE